jgi:hypothetical protein
VPLAESGHNIVLATSMPTTLEGALSAVSKGATSLGYKAGILGGAAGGASMTLKQAGGVKTYLYENGGILIRKGVETVFKYLGQ